MDIVRAIISGSGTALSLVKTLLTTPLLYEEGDWKNAVPIEVESYSQSGSAQVSESLVITANETETDGLKKYMSDNVAPSSWTWTMQGYIAGNPLLEPVNFYPWIMRHQRKRLRNFFEQGKRLIFKDVECEKHIVVIESLDLQWQSDCRNKQPVSITLKEINVMSVNPTKNSVIDKSSPKEGTPDGEEANNGVTQNQTLEPSTLRKGISRISNFF